MIKKKQELNRKLGTKFDRKIDRKYDRNLVRKSYNRSKHDLTVRRSSKNRLCPGFSKEIFANGKLECTGREAIYFVQKRAGHTRRYC